ncbi:PRC-barrel domain protein [Sulfitobacter sp. THAF37]|uniref:PRC-barrel domain-containing protein n=1 Tax=Sulfitobacter sp. THAF37 TaxID=2587855 RepID=UPI001267F8EE|nr:PRC-barrel domain-containing protein [Sulfitobacter sp. THAF37]QFT57410.1 PRC-barrel domain protein [Sulfitobacter sp. THAF37]
MTIRTSRTFSTSKLLLGASALTLAAVLPASAQQTNSTPVQGGEVVVEQKDAEVDVTVPEPDVNVTQGQPVVTVEQPQPEITVEVPEPTVRVQQQAPVITVEQAQPQITVAIPEPVVTIAVPNPEVDVNTGEPKVDLNQPEPVVRFVRPEPKITVQESEPNIQVESAEAQVDVAEAEEAKVDVNQAEAQVNVEQSGDANVVMDEAEDPQVNVERAEGADINVTQEEAQIVMKDYNADEQGNMSEDDRARYADETQNLPIFDMTVSELVGRSVATETGEDVGEVDFIGVRGDTIVAIIGVGGFLGMGENEVAVPVNQMLVRETELIVPGTTEERLESMPEFNESEVRLLDADIRLAEEVGLD